MLMWSLDNCDLSRQNTKHDSAVQALLIGESLIFFFEGVPPSFLRTLFSSLSSNLSFLPNARRRFPEKHALAKISLSVCIFVIHILFYLVNLRPRLDRRLGRMISFKCFLWISQGREGYLELGNDPVMPSEEADDDGYLKPREIVPPGYKTALFNGNITSGSNRDLQGSNRSLTNESKPKDLTHERYTELGFKPSNNANDLAETAL